MSTVHLPIPAFLARFAKTAQSLMLGRIVGSEAWALRRRICVHLFSPRQLAVFARLGACARGLN